MNTAPTPLDQLIALLREIETNPMLDYVNIDGYVYLSDILKSQRVVSHAVKHAIAELSAKLYTIFYIGTKSTHERNLAALTAAGYEAQYMHSPHRMYSTPVVKTKKGILVIG